MDLIICTLSDDALFVSSFVVVLSTISELRSRQDFHTDNNKEAFILSKNVGRAMVFTLITPSDDASNTFFKLCRCKFCHLHV